MLFLFFFAHSQSFLSRFAQQKEESKELVEKIKKMTSEIEIQEQLLEVHIRNTNLGEQRALQVNTYI